jgi:hypothetical protein
MDDLIIIGDDVEKIPPSKRKFSPLSNEKAWSA